MGDFNEITHSDEKWGGASRARNLMEDFQGALLDCHLSDLGFRGPKYTWTNGRQGRAFTKERLDRAVANGEWCSLFPNMEVSVLARRSSDHNPIFIAYGLEDINRGANGRPFRYDTRWSKLEGVKNTIKKVWRPKLVAENPWTRVKHNLSSCQRSLKVWVKKHELSNETLIKKKTKELEELQSAKGEPMFEEEAVLTEELHGLLE
jgi:hypothetical protein